MYELVDEYGQCILLKVEGGLSFRPVTSAYPSKLGSCSVIECGQSLISWLFQGLIHCMGLIYYLHRKPFLEGPRNFVKLSSCDFSPILGFLKNSAEPCRAVCE